MTRRVTVLLMAALAITTGRPSAAPECLESRPAVSVQIHDYEHLPSGWLSRASGIVSRIYGDIGVSIEWLGVRRQGGRRESSDGEQEPSRAHVAQLTVIIQTPQMAARGRIPDGVLGYAVVPPDGGTGRIAYVIYDRIRQLATDAPADQIELLGFVIAHETGHLLLGRGSGSGNGLMKCKWDRREMRLFSAKKVGFSDVQAQRIRETVTTDPVMLAAVGTAGSDEPRACGATGDEAVTTAR